MTETFEVIGEKEKETELTSTCREQVDRLHELATRNPVTACVVTAAAALSLGYVSKILIKKILT